MLDQLTISAITIVIVLVVVVIILARSTSNTEEKLRVLARHLALLQSNEEARELCREIREKYPDMCPGVDYTIREEGGHATVDEWKSSEPKP